MFKHLNELVVNELAINDAFSKENPKESEESSKYVACQTAY